MTSVELARKLVYGLNECGVGCEIYHIANSNQSAYIRFDDANIGSIRISNHEQRKVYNYKYNIRSDCFTSGRWIKTGKHWSYYIDFQNWTKMFDIMVERANYVRPWTKKRAYYTPEFKKEQ